MNHHDRDTEPDDSNWMEYAIADEQAAQNEADAVYEALPLRRMVGLKWSEERRQDDFVLECGHRVPRSLFLDDQARVRCRQCFREGMERAERMIEGMERRNDGSRS